jgi:peptidoglycan/xylan/chitin deacetylase (PgdA/CDA1 family)
VPEASRDPCYRLSYQSIPDSLVMKMRAISLAYHDVIDKRPLLHSSVRPGAKLYALSRDRFQGHLASIKERNAAVALIRSFRCWQHGVQVFLTFDDGALNAYCAADELEKYGWRGHFFVTTNWIGRSEFLNRGQIRELYDRGHVIGAHSCSHPERMSHLPWNRLTTEWSHSCAVLSDILGHNVKVASVPNGYHSERVAQAAAAAGIEILFTSEATWTCSVTAGCLILGRYLMKRHTSAELVGALTAEHRWPRWKQTLLWNGKKLLKGLMGESYLAVRRILLPMGGIPRNAE